MRRRTLHLAAGIGAAFALAVLTSHRVESIGGQFGLEWAIDAPWRLEPMPARGGGYTYGPIPIVVVFHDAVFEADRAWPARRGLPQIDPGTLQYVRVVEWVADQPHPRQPVTNVQPRALHEIERKPVASTKAREPRTQICRPASGQDCTALLRITSSHEWHAMFWYTPQTPVTPGRNIHLEVTAVTQVAGLFTHEWKNYLVVHAGEQPLPRFTAASLYGDFHYHSQMTDNEGESAYSYRNVARALGALGFDFVFATDHASNGEQVDGKLSAEFCASAAGGQCIEARDLNEGRFAMAKRYIYGADGVNEMIARDAAVTPLARVRTANVLPQLYVGEEVDAVPEISNQEQQAGIVAYGDGLKYPWPDSNECIRREGLEKCRRKYSIPYAPRDQRTHLLLDEQGVPVQETVEEKLGDGTLASIVVRRTPDLTRPEPSRQHLVYFPTSVSLNADGWIGSDTREFGGGGKRLQDVINQVQSAGVAFLAHPLTSNRPGGPGPDVVPYADVELNRAWSSPAILGLQFWNENDRHYSAPTRRAPTVMFTGSPSDNVRVRHFFFNWPFQGDTYGNFPWSWQRGSNPFIATELYHGAFTWDRILRKGLNPSETAALRWLAPGDPRKWFMAGGSDSHGDFNYRRYGRPCVDRWCDVPVGDTAIGSPRNLVLMSKDPLSGLPELTSTDPRPAASAGPTRHTNGDVIGRLRTGQFSVTDGPAIRIAVDKNRNGVIDDLDFQMGSTFHFFPGEHIPLLVEWFSTPEFGPVSQVDVYVGSPTATFAPKWHGPIIPPGENRNGEYGGYRADPSGALQITQGVAAESRFHGVAKVFIGPGQFGLAQSDQALSYVRAFVKTVRAVDSGGQCPPAGTAGSKCGDRYGYSNPIWARFWTACPARGGRTPARGLLRNITPFLDADANGVPDTCERDILNPCPATEGPRGRRGAGDLDRALDPSRPPGERPAKPVPSNSCQVVAAVPR